MPPRKVLLPAAVTLALMLTMRFVSFAPAEVGDAKAYHERAREAAFTIPQEVGHWTGADIEIPEAAVALLKPNVLIGRSYTNTETGRGFSLLLVQCGDARDMEGHFPPNCYPGNGWELTESEPFEIAAADRDVTGRSYFFDRSLRGLPEKLTVMNVIMLPTGAFGEGMTEVRRLAGTYRDRFYGAGQLQFVFNGEWPQADRRAVVEEFLLALDPVMSVIMRQAPITEHDVKATVIPVEPDAE